MSKYLTPEEVDELVADCAAPDVAGNRISATLREYAAIVEAVAVAQPYGEREGGLCSCRLFVRNNHLAWATYSPRSQMVNRIEFEYAEENDGPSS